MFQYFYPHDYKDSTYEINFEEYYKKGYRGVLFDIDNTLVMHGADADEKAEQLFRELKKIGFSTCLISNNKEERVKRFNKNIRTKNSIFVGDQIFTDVIGAKRCGMHCILVKPINPKEEIQIVLKRYLERPIIKSYEKYKQKKRK